MMTGALPRQVTLATADLAATSATLRAQLGAAPGFADPALEDWGIRNDIMRLDRTWLEVVAPTRPGSSIDPFLSRGDGGYLVGLTTPDADALVARAARLDVAVVHSEDFHGAHIVQLHPRRLGLLLEVDQMPAGREWHFDDWDAAQLPRATAAGDVVGVDVAVRDPAATAELWATLLDVPAPTGPPVLRLERDGLSTNVCFVPVTERRGLVAVEFAAPTDSPAPAPTQLEVAGTTLRIGTHEEPVV